MTHTMRGKWSEKGVPHKDWICTGMEDLGAPDEICGMCESMPIRYVHFMTHPEYPTTLGVGCICAGHMEENKLGAERREKDFKRSRARRDRWLQRTWRVSRNGNDYLNVGGFNVVVFQSGARWGGRITHHSSGFSLFIGCQYATEAEAKLMAFDVIQETEQRMAQQRGQS